MSEAAAYSKCACDHCAGRIEFPVEAAGMTIDCPHCEAKTTLVVSASAVPKSRSRRIRKRIVLPIAFAIVASLLFLGLIARPRSLAVRSLRFERASLSNPGAVYGEIENTSRRSRKNVRVEIDLLNSRGELLWRATDYTGELNGKGRWHFRALVLDPNVVTGRVARVHGE